MKEKMICRGDLFYYDFGDNNGSVQSGERVDQHIIICHFQKNK